MKNLIIPFVACLLLFTSCGKSNEERAEALIQEKVKCNLFHPDTYKPISTTVDSLYLDFETYAQLIQELYDLTDLLKKEREYSYDLESAQISMSIYSPPYYYNSEYRKNEHIKNKKKFENAKKKLERIEPKIDNSLSKLMDLSKNLHSPEFQGWVIEHKFTSMNGANTASVKGEMIFFCDKDFSKCSEGVSKRHISFLFNLFKEISELDSKDDVKDLVNDNLIYFEDFI
ncbi:MAG: hypothetical protein ACI4AH_07610 [Muribaculaceae bacterium]